MQINCRAEIKQMTRGKLKQLVNTSGDIASSKQTKPKTQ